MRNKNKTPNNDKLFFSRTLQYLDNYLPRQLGRSAETVRSYRDSLSRFRKYLYDEKGISIMKFAFQDCMQIASLNGHLCHNRRPACDLNSGQPGTH